MNIKHDGVLEKVESFSAILNYVDVNDGDYFSLDSNKTEVYIMDSDCK